MAKEKQSDRRLAELNKRNLNRANLARQKLAGASTLR